MDAKNLITMSNREVEDRAIAYVIAYEKAAGREATDTRGDRSAQVDVVSTDPATGQERHIEIKAYGGPGRGEDLWLEPAQVRALEEVPDPHLYVVTNVRSIDPEAIRVLDLAGEQLQAQLRVKKLREYYSVPMPVALYDALREASTTPAGITGTEFIRRVLEAVVVLHERGYHGIRYVAAYAPTGLSVRVFVGRKLEVPDRHPDDDVLDRVAYLSLDDAVEPAREFAGAMIPAWWTPVMIADQILARIPPVEPTADDPAYAKRLSAMLEAADGNVQSLMTEE